MSSPITSPRVLVIIPARYASTRFPGKPLVDIAGRPMIIRVVERALSVCSDVVVATDDERIRSVVEQYGYRAVMTSADLSSGTERCLEAYRLLGAEADVLVNLQGDEPFIADEQIRLLISAFVEDETTDIATLAQPFSSDTTNEELANPNAVKLVRATSGQALYFSRSVIPYLRGVEGVWASQHQYLKHIGLYAFRTNILEQLSMLPPSPLEQGESLEQLRWLSAGLRIQVKLSEHETIGIDTPEDLQRIPIDSSLLS